MNRGPACHNLHILVQASGGTLATRPEAVAAFLGDLAEGLGPLVCSAPPTS